MNFFKGIIDIYDGNDKVSLQKAWDLGIRAILHEASRGTYKRDGLYKERKEKALEMGFLWAGYHLLSAEDPQEQLDFFLEMEDGDNPKVGMAIDWEKSKNGQASGDQVREFVSLFNNRMKPKYVDRYPILYGGSKIREDRKIQNGDPLLAKCPLWYTRFNKRGAIEIPAATWSTYTLWQYDDEHREFGAPAVSILEGADFNCFQGTDADLAQQWPFGMGGV